MALALVQAILPKDLWLADRELEVPWPMWGIPESLQLDNAPEFHSRALIRGAQEYGIRIDYRPPASPHFGGHIERLIGTTMGAVHVYGLGDTSEARAGVAYLFHDMQEVF